MKHRDLQKPWETKVVEFFSAFSHTLCNEIGFIMTMALGILIDKQLKLHSHIEKICKKAAMRLNAIKRPARFMGSKEREVIVKSFILCYFNYCPLIRSLCSNASQKNFEKINERALRFAHFDYTSSYNTPPVKAKSTKIRICSIRLLALEIYNTSKKLESSLYERLFYAKPICYSFPRDAVLCVPKVKTTTYGIKFLRFLDPKIWMELSPK